MPSTITGCCEKPVYVFVKSEVFYIHRNQNIPQTQGICSKFKNNRYNNIYTRYNNFS